MATMNIIKNLKAEIRKHQEFLAYASILLYSNSTDLSEDAVTELLRIRAQLMADYTSFLKYKAYNYIGLDTYILDAHLHFLAYIIYATSDLLRCVKNRIPKGPIRKRIFNQFTKNYSELLLPEYMDNFCFE